MWVLRSIWKDLLWLNAGLPRVVKIGLLLAVIALLVKAWWLGSAYWLEPVAPRWMTVPRPRAQVLGVVVAAVSIAYITFVLGARSSPALIYRRAIEMTIGGRRRGRKLCLGLGVAARGGIPSSVPLAARGRGRSGSRVRCLRR